MKDLYISGIKTNSSVDSIFIIESPSLRNGGRHGKYISCTLSDKTGKISCRIWGRNNGGAEEVERIFNGLNSNEGSVFYISGESETYKNQLLVRVTDGIERLSLPVDPEMISPDDFEYTPYDIDMIRAGIVTFILKIEDPLIRDFIGRIIGDIDGFFEKPAAKKKHHAYRGGLAHHTLEVLEIAAATPENIIGVDFNKDVLIAGAILHDIGKCQSFERSGFAFSSNASYSLIGHITSGIMITEKYSDLIDEHLLKEILHIIQSHHGQYGEIKPQTIEAWTVHFADNMSAMLHEVSDDISGIGPGDSSWGEMSGSLVYRSKF